MRATLALLGVVLVSIGRARAGETLPPPAPPPTIFHMRWLGGPHGTTGGDGDHGTALAASPDARQHLCWTREGLQLMFGATRRRQLVAPQPAWGQRAPRCTVAWAPDGQRLALAVNDGPAVVYDARALDAGAEPIVWRDAEGARCLAIPSFSADGEVLTLLGARPARDGEPVVGTLRRVRLRDGREDVTTLEVPLVDVLAPRPAPGTDGSSRLLLSSPERLLVQDEPGAAPRPLDLPTRGLWNADVRPDGAEGLLFYRASPGHAHVGLVRVDLVTGAAEALDPRARVVALWYSPDGAHVAWVGREGPVEQLTVLAAGQDLRAARRFDLPRGAPCTGMAWDAASRRLALTTRQEVLVADLDGDDALRSLGVSGSPRYSYYLPAWRADGQVSATWIGEQAPPSPSHPR